MFPVQAKGRAVIALPDDRELWFVILVIGLDMAGSGRSGRCRPTRQWITSTSSNSHADTQALRLQA
jgi:hypothetical protein